MRIDAKKKAELATSLACWERQLHLEHMVYILAPLVGHKQKPHPSEKQAHMQFVYFSGPWNRIKKAQEVFVPTDPYHVNIFKQI